MTITIAPLPVGTLIDNPAALPAPRPPLIKRMCAGRPGHECGLVLGWVVGAPGQHGQISHTTCPACAAAALEELEEFLAGSSRHLP